MDEKRKHFKLMNSGTSVDSYHHPHWAYLQPSDDRSFRNVVIQISKIMSHFGNEISDRRVEQCFGRYEQFSFNLTNYRTFGTIDGQH